MRGQLLAELVRPLEKVASVYIGLNLEDSHVRWRGLAARLLAQGAPAHTVELLDRLVAQERPSPRHLAAFARDGKLLWHKDFSGWVPGDRAEFAAPPVVTPLLEWLSRHPAHVEVVMDRQGAELTTVAAGAESGITTTVVGPDDEIARGGPRRWDHPRIERRAASSWHHNAGAVADATAAALKKVDAELLLVAGQPRMVKLMLAQLPKGLRVTVERLPGGRGRDGSAAARHDAVQRFVERYAARVPDTALALSVWTVSDTLGALASGRVRTLLVADDPNDGRLAWFGADLLCTDRPQRGLALGRLVDVAVRAALLTDADVHVVPKEFAGPEGICAVCRFG
jgi:hypothetical protein